MTADFQEETEMIKGVNKKVIEINDTRNIYFEKAVLYVRPEMLDVPQSHLIREASAYMNTEKNGAENLYGKRKIKKVLYFFTAASAVSVIALIIIFSLIRG